MFNEETVREWKKETTTYPCGCTYVAPYDEGEYGGRGEKNLTKACKDHGNTLHVSDHAYRSIRAEMYRLSDKFIADSTFDSNPIVWEAFVTSLKDPAFVKVFETNITPLVALHNENVIEKRKQNDAATLAQIEYEYAKALLKEYEAVIKTGQKNKATSIQSYEEFLASKKQKK